MQKTTTHFTDAHAALEELAWLAQQTGKEHRIYSYAGGWVVAPAGYRYFKKRKPFAVMGAK